ncbi:MAG: exo-alpha-sialidase [Rhodothermales bacterium]
MNHTVLRSASLMIAFLFFFGCKETPATAQSNGDPIIEVETHAGDFSAEPKLVKSRAGKIYLSWITRNADASATLHASQFINQEWTKKTAIAKGTDWFINWADFPTMAIGDAEEMAASFLAKSGAGTYAYDVKITTSTDGGTSWNQAFSPHTDGTETEHGFVSLMPWTTNHFMAVWLDGRNTGSGGHDGHGRGAMTLRSALFDVSGNITKASELDNKTCDCCQTAAVRTGPASMLVAYRDRSDNEIRDIATVRYEGGVWSAPEIVHADQWQIAGCPVNGPALDSHNNTVAIAWFTAANDQPRVLLALSHDKGRTFSPPITIDEGAPLGRVSVSMLDNKTAAVSWLEKTEEAAEILVRTVKGDTAEPLVKSEPVLISSTITSRKSGFPQMTSNDDFAVFAWTDASADDTTIIRSAYIKKAWLTSLSVK